MTTAYVYVFKFEDGTHGVTVERWTAARKKRESAEHGKLLVWEKVKAL